MRLSLAIMTAAGLFVVAPGAAQARMPVAQLDAPSLAASVACRTVRERVVRPGGRVIYRTKQICSPRRTFGGPDCTVRRERVIRPNGSVVFRTVRRCD